MSKMGKQSWLSIVVSPVLEGVNENRDFSSFSQGEMYFPPTPPRKFGVSEFSEFTELDDVRFELDLYPSARNRNRVRFVPSAINGNRARLCECVGDSSSQRISSLKRRYRGRFPRVELERDFVLERPISSSVAQKQKLIRHFSWSVELGLSSSSVYLRARPWHRARYGLLTGSSILYRARFVFDLGFILVIRDHSAIKRRGVWYLDFRGSMGRVTLNSQEVNSFHDFEMF